MTKSCLWGECLAVVLCVSVVLPLGAASASAEVQRHLAEAKRLYEDLEYEVALERLQFAARLPLDEGEAVSLSLLRGIIHADMGKWEEARADFRSALLSRPDAQLPLKVSPKVSLEFETQRQGVRDELARGGLRVPQRGDGGAVATDQETKRPSLMPEGDTSGASDSPEWALNSTSDEEGRGLRVGGRRVPLVSMVLLGAGVAAGGAGAVFGLSSRGQVEDARSAQAYEDLERHHSRAQGSATTANVLFGTAAAATVGAVATWLLMGSTQESVVHGGER
nr:tetratricopeptide repeat protein [Myxococcus sp. MH1]